MGIVREVQQHLCNQPERNAYGYGTLWRCDDCNELWELDVSMSGRYWRRASWMKKLKYRGK